ncbi:Uncharacterised protein [Mycoplasmopsis maculosa]|uniref:Lipoprotein n=1 Tax=Mycoplasmopsis maculosa TaxID=114885 RepID=A0A449B3C6_9BACT|nr:hypothetical protein [Mycoplasmopsis maculosa]VEU75102.1 Uncharacterised protein [Mycoplasmopsis maculosa]
MRIKKNIFKKLLISSSILSLPILTSCSFLKDEQEKQKDKKEDKQQTIQYSNYLKEIIALNENKIDEQPLDSLYELSNHPEILEWKNPETDLSKIEIKNLYLNNFLENNLIINKEKLNILLKELGFKFIDKIKTEILINETNRDYSNVEYLSIPILFKRYIDTVSGINEYQTRKVYFKLKGLSIKEFDSSNKLNDFYSNFINRKNTLNSFLENKLVENSNTVKNDEINISHKNGLKIDYSLVNLSTKKLNEILKIRFNKLTDDKYYDNLDENIKKEIIDYNVKVKNNKTKDSSWDPAKLREKDLYNIEIKSFELDKNDNTKYLIKFKFSYGTSSNSIKSNKLNLEQNINNVGVDLIYKGSFIEEDIKNQEKDYLKYNANPQLKYDLSLSNYPFDEAVLDDFVVLSKNINISYEIKSLQKLENNEGFIFSLVSKSSIDKFNNKNIELEYKIKKHAYIFEKELQDSNNKYNILLGDIDSNILTKITTNIFEKSNNSKILPGGYGELRGFYNDPNAVKQIHLGEDVLVKSDTKIFAPFNAEIVSFLSRKNEPQFSGIGGQLVLRVKKEDLKENIEKTIYEEFFEDSNYVYIGIIHLDFAKTLQIINLIDSNRETYESEKTISKNITIKNPLKVNKGDLIAVVGNHANNGGWMSHAHISVWKDNLYKKDVNGYLYKSKDIEKRYKNQKYNSDLIAVGVPGVRLGGELPSTLKGLKSNNIYKTDANGNTIPELIKENAVRNTYLDIKLDELDDNLIDPNLIFNFRDYNTYSYDVHELFPELKENN